MGNINEEKNIRTHDMSRLINQHLSYEKINTDASASNLAEFLIHQNDYCLLYTSDAADEAGMV